MNTLFVLLLFLHLFPLIENRFALTIGQKRLILIGALQPLLDQVTRNIYGDIWYQLEGQYFHSLFYSLLFWGLLSSFIWAYRRDYKYSLSFLLPMIGLIGYAVISMFTTSSEAFFLPFSNMRIQLDWVKEGVLLPTVVLFVTYLLRIWKVLSVKLAGKISFLTTGFYFLFSGGVILTIFMLLSYNTLTMEKIRIQPQDWTQLYWKVIYHEKQKYVSADFFVGSGKLEGFSETKKYNDLNLAISILNDPLIFQYYSEIMRNPLLNVKIGGEVVIIELKELLHPYYPWRKRGVEWKKNKAGQIIEWNLIPLTDS